MSLSHLLAVGAGGFIGAIARYAMSTALNALTPRFPLGTLGVNVLGAFLLGLLATLFLEKVSVGVELRLLLLVGVLGAFTTFSTFSLETLDLIRAGSWPAACLSMVANLGGTLIAVWAGVALAKLW